MINGYDFYFDTPYGLLTLPITPGELNISNDSNNDTVTLINEGEVNILKSPPLMEFEFEARFPMRKYPYARTNSIRRSNGELDDFNQFSTFDLLYSNYTKEKIPYEFTAAGFKKYWDVLTKVKEEKVAIRFIVARSTPNGDRTWDTNTLVSIEELSTNESADEGDDVIVSFELKQFKEYGVKKLSNSELPNTTSTSNVARNTDNKASKSQTYTVKKGDCLWNIAKAAYGSGSKWKAIYEANKAVIESTAKKYGKSSSSNGHRIYPGTVLTIPNANTANLTIQKLKNSSKKTTKKSSKKSSKKTTAKSATKTSTASKTSTAAKNVQINYSQYMTSKGQLVFRPGSGKDATNQTQLTSKGQLIFTPVSD